VEVGNGRASERDGTGGRGRGRGDAGSVKVGRGRGVRSHNTRGSIRGVGGQHAGSDLNIQHSDCFWQRILQDAFFGMRADNRAMARLTASQPGGMLIVEI
jgi:hypothetical protein